MTDDLTELRRRVRPMLDLSAARDALSAYYALYHNPERTRLLIQEGPTDRVEAFLSICQTGRDLFRLTAVLRARNSGAAEELLHRELEPRRPYYLITTPDLHSVVEEVLAVEQFEINRVYRLDLSLYTPAISVLVVPDRAADGSPRFVIRSQGKLAAEAGTNWRSPHFAGLYAWTSPEARDRGWGKAVVESCANWVIRSGAQPLYIVSEDNQSSIRLAESVGFTDTGSRELAVEGTMKTQEEHDEANSLDER
ncbi:MAG: GNAT family N-acetyltransferase [Anaerolineae bacterium]|jgi:hypothetical protein